MTKLEEIRNHFAMVLASNAYINICESSDLGVAIEAMDKRIPEEPELEADGYDDYGNLFYEYGYCPDCRHEFEIDCFETPDYCPDCGKHLKWPDWVKHPE